MSKVLTGSSIDLTGDLFREYKPAIEDKQRARTTDPATSKVAAEQVKHFDRAQYGAILAALRKGNATHHEIGERCEITSDQAHKRLPEMRELGLIRLALKEDGSVLTRKGPSNRQCQVWELIADASAA